MNNEMQKTLVLTGASRGIGHATVKRFSSAGWRVITCSRNPVPENCPWQAGEDNHIQIDLHSLKDLERGAKEIIKKLGNSPLHALVNNAGISPKDSNKGRLNSLNTSLETWKDVFQVNFFAPIFLARHLKSSLELASGSIVNVTSIAGSRVHPSWVRQRSALCRAQVRPSRIPPFPALWGPSLLGPSLFHPCI